MNLAGMTPHFNILVWGAVGPLGVRQPMCEIEVDITELDGTLTISRHRGLELIPQKMLTQHAN
jgi:hypothetical protein